ncbi:MAG: transcriptional repressor [Endomicrobia bacterium]|nr:transcriptional repressor [Endomicrobiia bacterium]
MKLHLKNINQQFSGILKQKKLRNTKQRQQILEVFFSTDGHLSIDELYSIVKNKNPKIGYATVHRTLKLLSELGIAEGIKISNQKILYEHKYEHKHHDHLVCIKCGNFIEFLSEKIEILQKNIAKEFNFNVLNHKLIIYGICEKCSN